MCRISASWGQARPTVAEEPVEAEVEVVQREEALPEVEVEVVEE